jgi:GR25 family glycosyltransferase involved in LPS biosynthesis
MKTYYITLKNLLCNQDKLLYLRNFNLDPIIVSGINGNKEYTYINSYEYKNYINEKYKIFGPRGAIGCFLSHIKCWKRFTEDKDNKDDNIMVLEDDVIFEDNFNQKLKLTLNDISQKNDILKYDILYLGYIGGKVINSIGSLLGINREEKIITNNIIIPKTSLALHAYIISRKGINKILNNLVNNKLDHHFDYYLQSSRELNCYSCSPRIAYQTSTDTLNSFNISCQPILLSYFLSNFYIDKMVKTSYLTCVSFARLGQYNINITSIILLLTGSFFALKKINIKKITLFYLLFIIPDLYIIFNKNSTNDELTNDINTIIFNYLFLIIPSVILKF